MYAAPTDDLAQSLLLIKNVIPQNDRPFILSADLNARSQTWGYGYEDQRGRTLLEFLATNNLMLQNSQYDNPTFEKGNKRGWPDVTITNTSADSLINSWQVLDEHTASDHKYIQFTITRTPCSFSRGRYKTEYSKHTKFNKLFKQKSTPLASQIEQVQTKTQLDEYTLQLINLVQNISKQCYKIKKSSKQPEFKWWNSKLATKRNKIRALQRKLIKTIDMEKQQTLKQMIKKEAAMFKKDIRKAKRERWIDFCSTTLQEYGTAFKMAHGRVFKMHDVEAFSTTDPNVDKQDLLTKLTNYHFPQPDASTIIHSTAVIIQQSGITSTVPSTAEIKAALRTINVRKAPGPDNIDGRILNQVFRSNTSLLTLWVQKCFSLTHFPKCLKTGEVIYFRKKGKTPEDASAYRPICLLPSFGKLLEKILVQRLVYILEHSDNFCKNQYGFREMTSTDHALQDLLSKLKNTKDKFKYAVVISLDIKGAFDNLPWLKIHECLASFNCTNDIRLLIKSYLSDRAVLINWDTGSRLHRVYKGCPQGSCLGPILWNVVANSLLLHFKNAQSEIIAYADDFLLLAAGNTRRELEKNCNDSLTIFGNWLSEVSLKVSPGKTVAMLFGKLKRLPIIRLQGEKISFTNFFRYLGIILDNKLNWFPHLNNLKEKAIGINNLQLKLAPNTWGIQPHLLKIWYHVVAERILSYGASAWGGNLTKAAIIKLNSIQRILLLRITRAYNTTPTSALSILAGIPPLSLKILAEHKRSHLLQLKRKIIIDNIYFSPEDTDIKLPRWHLDPCQQLAAITHLPISETQSTAQLNLPQIFTDGSRTAEGVAAAYVVYINGIQISQAGQKLASFNTVYQAETQAIILALEWCKLNEIKETYIYTDNRSVYDATKQHRPQNVLIRKIQHLSLTTTLNLGWVRAHVGLTGNEAADTLAKLITESTASCEPLPIPRSYIKKLLTKELIKEWQNLWNTATTGRAVFKYRPYVSTTYHCPTKALIYFLTGHGPFMTYLNRFNITDTQDCVCGEIGTPLHYLSSCPTTQSLHIKPPPTNGEAAWLKQLEKSAALKRKLQHLVEKLQADTSLY